VGCVSEAAAATMGRAELAAVVQHVLKECGASCLKDVCDLLEDEDGRADIISVLKSDACHAAAAQADSAPALSTVTLHVTVSAPPPPPPSIKVVMQITVPKPSTADVGSATDRCRMRTAQAQTAFSLYGITRSAQTHTTALSMVEAGTTTEGTICKANVSTDTFLDKVGGHVKRAVQTEEAVVPASDYKQLGDSLAASVDEAQQAKVALAKRTADLEGLLMAIIRRKRIVMDRMRYHVYCEGEASDMGEPRDGVYEVSYCPLK
jgi:hypothetical protein